MIFALGVTCGVLSLINLFSAVYCAAVERIAVAVLCATNFAVLMLLVQIGVFG